MGRPSGRLKGNGGGGGTSTELRGEYFVFPLVLPDRARGWLTFGREVGLDFLVATLGATTLVAAGLTGAMPGLVAGGGAGHLARGTLMKAYEVFGLRSELN